MSTSSCASQIPIPQDASTLPIVNGTYRMYSLYHPRLEYKGSSLYWFDSPVHAGISQDKSVEEAQGPKMWATHVSAPT